MFHKPPLYWYHHYIAEHEKVKKVIVTPQKQHFKNERELRLERDENKDRIDKLSRRERFIERDTDHENLKLQNKKVKLESKLKSSEKMATQRMTAIKFQINHNEMWKVYYEERLQANNQKLTHSKPIEVIALKDLIDNDKQRIGYYRRHCREQYELLKQLQKKETAITESLNELIANLKRRIGELKMRSTRKITGLQDRINSLKRMNRPIQQQINEDEKLDALQRNEQHHLIKKIAKEKKEKHLEKKMMKSHKAKHLLKAHH